MPFDGTHFDPPPSRPVRPRLGETTLIIGVGVVAVLLLALPVPFAALADIVHYLAKAR
jgi:hypothetical protein